MEEDIQKKTYEEVAALKDLFLRRLMDDKIKAAAIVRLNENNEALQRQLDERAITSFVKEILLICDRIDAQDTLDDLTCSVEEELLEVLARRDFYKMPPAETFDPACHNAVGENCEKWVSVLRQGVSSCRCHCCCKEKRSPDFGVILQVANLNGKED